MSERRYDVRTFEKDYACDQPGCGGFMRPTGMDMLLTYPPRWTHACTVCGIRRSFEVRYPTLAYRREPQEQPSHEQQVTVTQDDDARDAARYRWLRSQSFHRAGIPAIYSFDADGGEWRLDGKRADDEIDELMTRECK